MEKNYFDRTFENELRDDNSDELSYVNKLLTICYGISTTNEKEKEDLNTVLGLLTNRMFELMPAVENENSELYSEHSSEYYEELMDSSEADKELLYDGTRRMSGVETFDAVKFYPDRGYEGVNTDLLSDYVYIPGFGHFNLIKIEEVFGLDEKHKKI